MATSSTKIKIMKKLATAGHTDLKKLADLPYRTLKGVGLSASELDIFEDIANHATKADFVWYLLTDDKSSTPAE